MWKEEQNNEELLLSIIKSRLQWAENLLEKNKEKECKDTKLFALAQKVVLSDILYMAKILGIDNEKTN